MAQCRARVWMDLPEVHQPLSRDDMHLIMLSQNEIPVKGGAGETAWSPVVCLATSLEQGQVLRYDRGITDQYNSTVTFASMAFF